MQLNKATKLAGKFKIVVENSDTKNKRVLDWQDNVILNQLLSSTVNKLSSYCYVRFGTGTTTPAVNNTSLASPIAASINTAANFAGSIVVGVRDGDIHTKTFRWKFVGAQGQVTGNITELGLATSSNNMAALFTRALIKDESGNPTTLPLGVNDILTIYYEISNITDCSVDIISSKTFSFNGNTVTANLRLINQDAANNNASDLVYYSLLSTGTSAALSSANLAAFILPTLPYITVANGSIANYRNVSISSLTSVINRNLQLQTTNINGVGLANTIQVGVAYTDFVAGVGTGTWKYLFFNGWPATPVDNQAEMNRCNLMIEFDPPLAKAAADKFVFNTLQFIAGGAPV